MELSLYFDANSFSGSQSIPPGGTSSSSRRGFVRLPGRSSSSSGSFPVTNTTSQTIRNFCRVACSSRSIPPPPPSSSPPPAAATEYEKPTTSPAGSGGGAFQQQQQQQQGYLNWINSPSLGTLSSWGWGGLPGSLKVLDASDDEYGGVLVNPDGLPSDPDTFASALLTSLSHWRNKGKKGVWLKLPVEYSQLVPVAVREGFEYHHAEKGYVMLTYWIPDGPCLLPANASHQVGVGGFVINDSNEVLVVQEKYCTPAVDGYWKIPTGFIQEAEEIHSGAVREVEEETGVQTDFLEVIAFRHAQNMAFEKSDLFFVCMLKPLSTNIKVDDHEIKAAKWMPLDEFVKQPPVQEDHMFKKVVDIFMARLGHKYCGLFAHQLASKFDGHRSSTLYYSSMKDPGGSTNCRAAA